MENSVALIAAEMGWGAQRHETALGPREVSQFLGVSFDHVLASSTPFSPNQALDYPRRLHEIASFSQHLSNVVADTIKQKQFPIVVGGDHSMAIGTWSGVVSACDATEEFGLIWIDAHMDSHTPSTSPSMAIHGMPLAVLMGHGEASLTDIQSAGAKLSSAHVVLIGARSFESGEEALLKKLNVKVYYIDEVKKRGFFAVLQEAVTIVSKGTKGFGVSVDLDAFDPKCAPGVGSPEKNGIDNLVEIEEAFQWLAKQRSLKAIEIAELNPTLDIDHKTSQIVRLILSSWQETL